MTLSFSSDVYTEMVQVQQAQIQALQNKIQELEARIDVLQQQSILFI
jgi:cell division protein FtsB